MRYRVAFAKRFQSDGKESVLDPSAELDVYLPDGVVADKAFVERFEPQAQHNQEVLDEDDAFLGVASPEVWEYDVVDNRAQDFEDAIRNSETVMEFEVVDETVTDPAEATEVLLGDSTRAPEQLRSSGSATYGASGVRGVDDGPGGQPTADPGAGTGGPNRSYLGLANVEGIVDEGAGSIDDLNIISANDPSLGLTNYGVAGPDDWAADAGPTGVPDRGIQTDSSTDNASTLSPDKS